MHSIICIQFKHSTDLPLYDTFAHAFIQVHCRYVNSLLKRYQHPVASDLLPICPLLCSHFKPNITEACIGMLYENVCWRGAFALYFLATFRVNKKSRVQTRGTDVDSACLELVHICRKDDLKQANSGKDGLLSRGTHLTGEGFGLLSFINSNSRLSGWLFSSSYSLSDTRAASHPKHIFFSCRDGL